MTFPCQSKAKTNVKDLSYINLKTAVEEGGRSFICDFCPGKTFTERSLACTGFAKTSPERSY